MKVVVAGLGRMGMQVCRKLVEAGHETGAYNRSPEKVDKAAQFGALPLKTRESVAEFLNGEGALWLMISAEAVDEELEAWLKILPTGSILVDGGNSDFRLTRKRAEKIGDKLAFLDVGTSGGILGMEQGFSMMAGGDKPTYERVTPILETLAKPRGGYDYFGTYGSGHFVKMVHNAIEYGMMESLAEGYRILKEGPYRNLDLAKAAAVWQKASVIESTLNGLCREELVQNPDLEGIGGVVEEKGETRWTLEVAQDMSIPMPGIQAALDVRIASQKGEVSFATKLLAAMRNRFGGHKINPNE